MKYNFLTGKVSLPAILKDFYRVFEENGFEAYLVGGAVRDIFLNKKASDWDVATNAKPEDVMNIFKFVVPTGIAHGTVTVHFKKTEIEVTTFRTESTYSDGRHPDNVAFASSIQEDLSRRDFTMNAIAVNLKDGKIVDPFNGRKDIKARLIKTVGNPHERFMEDGLRPIRGLRFSSQLDFHIEENTYKEISQIEVQEKIKSISLERFRDELIKILSSSKPSVALKKMEEQGILQLFIPELLPCRNCVQGDLRSLHDFDVLDHLFYACDGAPKDNLKVRLAALFHDIGKPKAKKISLENGEEKITFYMHEKYSSQITEKILFRLKFPNAEISDICHLIEEHMFHYESNWTNAAVRRFLVRVKPEFVEDLFLLRLADIYGMHNKTVRIHDSLAGGNLVEFKSRIEKVLEEKSALSIKDLKISGTDLMEVGIPGGREMGKILKSLFETVTEDPNLNTKESLLNIAQKIYQEMK